MGAARRRPRVTWVIGQLGLGGSERRLYQLLRYLYPDKVQPQVITFAGGAYEEKIRELGIPVINLGDSRPLARRLGAVISEIRSFEPDIVHGMDWGGIYGRVAAKCAGVSVIISGFSGSLLPNRFFCWVEYALLPITDYIVSNSYAGQRYLLKAVGVNPKKVRVIRNGFDYEEARRWVARDLHEEIGLDRSRPIVGQVSRLEDVKNPCMFVEVAARVHREIPNAHFVIVGGGPLQAEIESLAASKALNGHLTLLGERPDAASLIPSFAVGVLTSRAEGLPNSLLEYMFWARPTVVTDVGDCRTVVQDGATGFVVPPGDINKMSERLIYLLRHPEERLRFGQAARRRLELEFSIKAYCVSLLALYYDALENKGRFRSADREVDLPF